MKNIFVYTGPMKSGKSSHIISEATAQIKARTKVAILKPSIDNRFGMDFVIDRNGHKLPAVNISSIEDIEKYDEEVNAESYFVDEFQFLNGDIGVISKLAEKGKKLYIAGLNLTAEKKIFGKMGELMELADKNNVRIFTARCDCCGKNAIYSFCSAKKDGDVLVGTDDIYKAVCPECYERLMREKTKDSVFRSFNDDDDAR